MIWVSWRQQRAETLIAVAVLILLAALLVPTGIQMADAYRHDGLSACVGPNTSSACEQAIESFSSRFEQLVGVIGWFNLLPGLIGVLFAAPFLLELEQGTYRLAWTQSITRRRWITTKLAITLAAALLAAGAITLLMTWWRSPLDHFHGRLEAGVFNVEGTVVVGYTLFALGLALAVGAIWRRTVAAALVAFAGYAAARLFVETWLRQRYEPPLTATWANTGRFAGPDLRHAWVLSEQPTDRLGHVVSFPFGLVGTCSRAISNHVRTISPACLARHGAGFTHAVYQPGSRFWLFQGIETAVFAGVGVTLTLLAAWWVHTRTS